MVPMAKETLERAVSDSAAMVKTTCGIGNNAAWSVALEALDHVRKHPRYKHGVKQAFLSAVQEFKNYECELVYATENRLFHVADLTPEYRKRYGDITDREYYEFWCSTGASAYVQKRVWVTNLWNKFRLSLIGHKVQHPDEVAWGMAASAALLLATCMYDNSVRVCVEDYKVPRQLVDGIFGKLNMIAVAKKWDKALMMLEPFTATYDLTELEQKNIQQGLDQLQEQWTSTATYTGALTEAVDAYEEVFRTKGEQKKALRLIAEMREG